jgi:hypothetical protein
MRGFNSDEVLNRAVRGTVRVMKDGDIRWSFVSVCAREGQCKSRMADCPPPEKKYPGFNMQPSRPVEVRYDPPPPVHLWIFRLNHVIT